MTAALVAQSAVDQTAGELVRRTRAGDQNAWALIYKIGQAARKGVNTRAKAAHASLQRYIAMHPAEEYALAAEPPLVMATPASSEIASERPSLPPGAFANLFDPEQMALTILQAARYRDGLNGAAVVLASGPLLDKDAVFGIAQSTFGSDDARRAFLYGVQFSGEGQFRQAAPRMPPPSRRCMAVGQCIGRARNIQAVRMPGSRIGRLSTVSGWELGE